jgi:NTP pyrophosphatase (non-canonical NTP hydrolase)
MEINEYRRLALRTSDYQTILDLLVNGALGLCGEAGEVVDLIKKHCFQGHELDVNKLIIELGDVCWYIAILAKGAKC